MIIVITGPTATGKTAVSNELAKAMNGEIINADSTQVYKELDIATAKVTEKEMQVSHHLIDIKNIEEDYTVYEYQRDCRKKIEEIQSKNKIPIIVGGTGLYIKAALYDYQFEKEENLENYNQFSNEELYEKLKDKNNIHINNRKRMIRALINENSNVNKNGKDNLLYDVLFIGLTMDRKKLYDRINKRVDIMLETGLIEEAKKLRGKDYKSIMTPIGYKELFMYFSDEISREEAIELIKKRSRNYAKRQYTFFNNQFDLNWINVENKNTEEIVGEIKWKYLNF